jgi:hypothetical protein
VIRDEGNGFSAMANTIAAIILGAVERLQT